MDFTLATVSGRSLSTDVESIVLTILTMGNKTVCFGARIIMVLKLRTDLSKETFGKP